MADRAPLILQFGCAFANTCPAQWQQYGIGVDTGVANASDTFPLPATFPFPNSTPAKPGDVIVFYAVGLGQTSPPAAPLVTGAVAPSSPLPAITPTYSVCFAPALLGTPVCTPAQYSGATPGSVGLYQINVEIPKNAPTGGQIYMTLTNGEPSTNQPAVFLAIQ